MTLLALSNRMVGVLVLNICINLLQAYSYVLLAYCVLSWFLSPLSRFMRLLQLLVDPVLAPFRRLLDRLFRNNRSALRMDFSPLLVFFVIRLLTMVLSRLIWVL